MVLIRYQRGCWETQSRAGRQSKRSPEELEAAGAQLQTQKRRFMAALEEVIQPPEPEGPLSYSDILEV